VIAAGILLRGAGGPQSYAFEWPERAYQQRDGGLSEVKVDLLLDRLHSDSRFKALLKKMNPPEQRV
jgi:hypothetical protein